METGYIYNTPTYRTESEIAELQKAFLNKVYSWMVAGLGITAGVSYYFTTNNSVTSDIKTPSRASNVLFFSKNCIRKKLFKMSPQRYKLILRPQSCSHVFYPQLYSNFVVKNASVRKKTHF